MTRELIVWLFQFMRNSSQDFEPSAEEFTKMVEAYEAGYDPWEAAAAIGEGRWPPYTGQGVEPHSWKRRFLQ